ncbi:1-acyl-sn-glycerol-3-phosphate acyltransferase alpha [Halyomorpha halys]|uniref:1-acyl-sn-glycerol-3-phosphate acyltransferase alpha n=1 Tax=Halyomorpha halys TaxID=286706 RepID=UPI0006D4FB52|nr:1-acyl-sn-glycerol-3-phosphate acyltransferase alpha-like [Halyomorpha halys]
MMYPHTETMVTFNDAISIEVILLISIVIAILSPLVPNSKLRYYTCYICYIAVLAVVPLSLAPIIIIRPKNVYNLRLIGNITRHFTKIIGIKWELRNGKILREKQGAIIAANHQSLFDTMGMFNIWDVMDKCAPIAKKEILYAIPFGPIAWLSGVVFIDREKRALAINNLKSAAKVLKKKRSKLWIFPEGTRNKEAKSTLPFKNGAFRTAIESQVPIIPLVYSPYSFIDSKNKTFSKGKIIMSVLEPISTEGLTIDDLEPLKERVHKLMSDEYQRLKEETAMSQ